ncbi:hypothetical protein BGZ54_003416, partial [Gamsiella multidivaricata]
PSCEIKVANVHWTVECINSDCLSSQCEYVIKARDSHATVTIAIIGASAPTESNRTYLAPFPRKNSPF